MIVARPFGRLRRDGHLPLRGRRAADQADLAVRPVLRRDPLDLIRSVRGRRSENVVVPLGEEVSALVGADVRVAALHRVELRRHIGRGAEGDVPEVHVVGRADEDRRHRPVRVLRAIHVELHLRPIPHGHHELPIDDCDPLQLALERIAPRDERRVPWSAPLRRCVDGAGDGQRERQARQLEAAMRRTRGAHAILRTRIMDSPT